MSDGQRVVVSCTHGEDDADRVLVAHLVAVAALEQGKEVVMFLTSEGVRVAIGGYADRLRPDREPTVPRVHGQFAEKGGRYYVCPICFKDRDLDESQLVANAEIKGATPLMEFAGEGALTFSY